MPIQNIKHREKQKQLHFRFTQTGFVLDDRQQEYAEEVIPWKEQFEADKWKAVYTIGFEERPQWLDAAGLFLYQVADGFQQMLTHQPDLEVAREHVEVPLDENVMERLLNSVPFTLGAEYVNEKWLKGAFSHLQSVYAGEIAAYDGTVALYLADKSQHLKVPERIFFHLVESREEDYPFAFLATYATKDAQGKVRHMPLAYALTEYQTDRE